MSLCQKRRSDNEPCGAQAVGGTDACRVHAGRPLAEQKARGQVIVTLREWGADDIPEEPGLLLMKLMTVTEWRRQEYAAEINRVLAEAGLDGNLSDALIGDTVVVDKDGSPHKVGEYVRGIVQLEAQERERAALLAVKVLAANVQERLTRVQEQTASLFLDYVTAIYGDPELGMTAEQVARLPAVAARHLRALGPAAA